MNREWLIHLAMYHLGQLSQAIPCWISIMKAHKTRHVMHIHAVSQCKLVPGWGIQKRPGCRCGF